MPLRRVKREWKWRQYIITESSCSTPSTRPEPYTNATELSLPCRSFLLMVREWIWGCVDLARKRISEACWRHRHVSLSLFLSLNGNWRKTDRKQTLSFLLAIWRKAIKTVLTEQDIAKNTDILLSFIFKSENFKERYVQIFFVIRDYVSAKDKHSTI